MQRSCAYVNSPYKRKCWLNSGCPLVDSLLWGTIAVCSSPPLWNKIRTSVHRISECSSSPSMNQSEKCAEQVFMNGWSQAVCGLHCLVPKEIRSRQWLISEESRQSSYKTNYWGLSSLQQYWSQHQIGFMEPRFRKKNFLQEVLSTVLKKYKSPFWRENWKIPFFGGKTGKVRFCGKNQHYQFWRETWIIRWGTQKWF